MFEEETKALEELRESLKKLNQIEGEALGRREELGTAFNFEQGIPIFERTLKLFRDLSECNFDNLPLGRLNSLKQSADQALTAFNEVKRFNLEAQQNPREARDRMIKKIENDYPTHFDKLSPIIAYSVRKGTDFARLEREGKESLQLMGKIRTDHETRGKEMLDDMATTLGKVRQAAADVGVAQHSVHFANESKHHLKWGRGWLITTGLVGIVTVAFAWFSLHTALSGDSPFHIIRFTVSRILIISILSYGLVWSARNYSAHKHNEVINKHRQNALSTFEAFVKATDDQETKNAVLLQATHCIFTPQRSGYLGKDSEPSSTNRFIEILRQIAPSGKET